MQDSYLCGISFHAVVVFGLGKNLLFKPILGRCAPLSFSFSDPTPLIFFENSEAIRKAGRDLISLSKGLVHWTPCTIQGPLITDGRNSIEMLTLPTGLLQDDPGISKVMKISLPNLNDIDFRSLESTEKKIWWEWHYSFLLSRPYELGHFQPFSTMHSQGIELTKTLLFILKVLWCSNNLMQKMTFITPSIY